MVPRFKTVIVVWSLCVPALVLAQAASNTTQRDSRRARQDARELRAMNKQLSVPAEEPPEPPSMFSLGVAQDWEEGGTRTASTPFALSHLVAVQDDAWKFQLKGEGYARQRQPGAPTLSGLKDLQFQVDRPFARGFTGSFSVTAPTRGDVGSQTWSQEADLAFDKDLAQSWHLSTSVALGHENGVPAGTSAYTKRFYIELSHEHSKDHTLLVNLARTWRAGKPSTTDVGIEYDFPLLAKNVGGVISLTRGITSGSRHTTIEFDVQHKF